MPQTKTRPPESSKSTTTAPAAADAADDQAVKAAPAGRSSSSVQRSTWEHDGRLYEVRQLGDFGIAEQQQLNRDGREFYELWTSSQELTADQGKRLKMLLERMFSRVLDAPKTVKATFNDAAKADVVLHFTLAPLRQVLSAAASQEQEPEVRESPSTTTS